MSVKKTNEYGTNIGRSGRVSESPSVNRLSSSAQGQIPAFKVGSDWRFNQESVERWVKELEVPDH